MQSSNENSVCLSIKCMHCDEMEFSHFWVFLRQARQTTPKFYITRQTWVLVGMSCWVLLVFSFLQNCATSEFLHPQPGLVFSAAF